MPDFLQTQADARARIADKKYLFFIICSILAFLLALYLRTSGLFRGLGETGYIFHPDEAKQILALFNFLNGDYVRYYGSLFYDGYPYGLNHLDEYLLRPILLFFTSEIPYRPDLYYLARLLRLTYSVVILCTVYQLVVRLTHNRASALLALLLIGVAPLSISVTHFATGDIGVDLFTALCLLFLLFYGERKHAYSWLLCCGISIGAAFSAKYNGLLIGMIPGMVIVGEFIRNRHLGPFVIHCCILVCGSIIGILIFTPNLFLDFKTTLINIAANFEFIKNYNVPAEVLAKPWFERAYLGILNNSRYIISSLGYVAVLTCIAGLFFFSSRLISYRRMPRTPFCSRSLYLFSLAIFPLLALLIALSGKFVVQPFHFSYLQIPLIIVSCVFIAQLMSSANTLLKSCGVFIALLLLLEFGQQSWKENFFWRLEDNGYHAENLPASIYDKEAFYSHRSDPIRSLLLEDSGTSVFRNHRVEAKGPDAFFWKTIELAPLPQVANPVGKDWIFLNGPTFPRNERTLVIHTGGIAKTIKRYLVLPADKTITGMGIQSGSHGAAASITLGGERLSIGLDAHQQKILAVTPREWRVSGSAENTVHVIPLTVSVPNSSLWVTIFTSEREKELFNLFGGGQNGRIDPPQPVPETLKDDYFGALSRISYLEYPLSWRVKPGESIPMWEVALQAGRYTLTCDIDGLQEESEIAIEFRDAKGGSSNSTQAFTLRKGIQRIEYSFSKTSAPYQIQFIIHNRKGIFHMMHFKLTPDYRRLSEDFELWRQKDLQPEWAARFGK